MTRVGRDLPSGTVTFVFTDVEGSTKLLHALGAERYGQALARHREIVRAACSVHGGVEVDTQGDAFFVAFPTAPGALAAAARTTAALASGPIRVRIGIHTGTPLLGEEGYVGVDVHRAARIGAAGHGGQVLISSTTAALVETGGLRDLGAFRLKDLKEPERIYQLGDHEFPPLKALNPARLPVAVSALIGRSQELIELHRLLTHDERLVTVTGPGGIGKTCFALQAAAEMVDVLADSVFWVSLQAVTEPEFLLPTIAETVGAGEDPMGFLRGRQTLLVLDNLEHLLAAAPVIAELLANCPLLLLLVTSRAPLRIAGEHIFPLDPLPDRDASELFVQRARAAGRRVDADETVTAICHRLDNLPLALELAAARTRVLDAPALLARLDNRLPILSGGRRDAPERQRTLRATIAWSHDLLDPEAKRLFAHLGVFAGSFTLAAAEAVCDADLDALCALLESSLLKAADQDGFQMLETINAYARERLDASVDANEMRNRHANHFLALIPQVESDTLGVPELSHAGLDRLEADYDNVRAAFEWLRECGESTRALALAHCLFWSFLNVRGRMGEGRAMLEMALSTTSAGDERQRAAALVTYSILLGDNGDREAARRCAQESLLLAQELNDTGLTQRALRTLARYQDDESAARRMLLDCERLARELDDAWSLGFVLWMLGAQAVTTGKLQEARCRFEEELVIFERLGQALEVARSLLELGCVAALEERFGDAKPLLRRALSTVADLGATNHAAACFIGVAAVLVSEGDAAAAAQLLAAATRITEDTGEIVEQHRTSILQTTEATARAELGTRFEHEWEAGAALTLEEAVGLALR